MDKHASQIGNIHIIKDPPGYQRMKIKDIKGTYGT